MSLESKWYADRYEREYQPSLKDYADFIENLLLPEFLELFCFDDIEDELGEHLSNERMFNWWDNQLPEYKHLKFTDAFNEQWRFELYEETEKRRIEEERY